MVYCLWPCRPKRFFVGENLFDLKRGRTQKTPCVNTLGVFPRLTMIQNPQPHPLHRFRLVCSRNPDELSNSLVDLHKARDIDFGGDLQNFHSISAFLPLKHLDLAYSDCTASLNMTLPAIGKVKQKIALRG